MEGEGAREGGSGREEVGGSEREGKGQGRVGVGGRGWEGVGGGRGREGGRGSGREGEGGRERECDQVTKTHHENMSSKRSRREQSATEQPVYQNSACWSTYTVLYVVTAPVPTVQSVG